MKKVLPTFWLTNISNRNVSLSDLNLTVKAFNSVNLLDNKHYHYTLSQLEQSVGSGSIYKKRDKIVVRKTSPQILNSNITLNNEAFPNRERSILNIKEEYYEELTVLEDQKTSDEKFANENAELADLDTKKII